MADNYLEKKMEEHRSRMAAGAVTRPRRSAAATQALVFPERRVLVIAEGRDWQRDVITALRGAGHKVAIIDPHGATLAQATGARCYPFTTDRVNDVVEDIIKRWGGLDITVKATRDDEISVENSADGFSAAVTAADDSDAAAAVVMLTHPSARLIHGSESLHGE